MLAMLTILATLAILPACADCPSVTPIHTTIRVHVPHSGLVPKYCTSDRDDSCREADRVFGLTYLFEFDQHAEGRLWCSYPSPPGVFRTPLCDDVEITTPQSARDVSPPDERNFHVVVQGCEPTTLAPPREGDACGVLTRSNGLPVDSCGESMFCRSMDSRCAPLPEACASDAECNDVMVIDETGLRVRFACDIASSECVWPDECLDTSDCERSHSRCISRTGRCHTFTCETGRCVGVAPR
ncbi:MAG: hypothetical protein JRH11_04520 [Deltaproteobacteria bacterium]|nr:hypothetical protein [Deltaproteobacteria bacterium]